MEWKRRDGGWEGKGEERVKEEKGWEGIEKGGKRGRKKVLMTTTPVCTPRGPSDSIRALDATGKFE